MFSRNKFFWIGLAFSVVIFFLHRGGLLTDAMLVGLLLAASFVLAGDLFVSKEQEQPQQAK